MTQWGGRHRFFIAAAELTIGRLDGGSLAVAAASIDQDWNKNIKCNRIEINSRIRLADLISTMMNSIRWSNQNKYTNEIENIHRALESYMSMSYIVLCAVPGCGGIGGGLGTIASESLLLECMLDIWLAIDDVSESGDWMMAAHLIIGVDVCRTRLLAFLSPGLIDWRPVWFMLVLFCRIDEQLRMENVVSDSCELVLVDECCRCHICDPRCGPFPSSTAVINSMPVEFSSMSLSVVAVLALLPLYVFDRVHLSICIRSSTVWIICEEKRSRFFRLCHVLARKINHSPRRTFDNVMVDDSRSNAAAMLRSCLYPILPMVRLGIKHSWPPLSMHQCRRLDVPMTHAFWHIRHNRRFSCTQCTSPATKWKKIIERMQSFLVREHIKWILTSFGRTIIVKYDVTLCVAVPPMKWISTYWRNDDDATNTNTVTGICSYI